MRYTVLHDGVPIGTAALIPRSGMVAGDFAPLPAYAAVRDVIRDATHVLWEVGLFGVPGDADRSRDAVRAADTLAQAAALRLELRDATGQPVPTAFVNVLEMPSREPELTAVVRFEDAHAPVGARLPRPPRREGDARPPEA